MTELPLRCPKAPACLAAGSFRTDPHVWRIVPRGAGHVKQKSLLLPRTGRRTKGWLKPSPSARIWHHISGLAHRTQAANHPESHPPFGSRTRATSKETLLASEKRIWEAYKAQHRAVFQSLLSDDFEGVNVPDYPFDKARAELCIQLLCHCYNLKDAKVILLPRTVRS